MSLKITLKPHERIIIDGAVITNGNSAADLFIENSVPLLRQQNILSESEADSPCRRIYFVIQLMYVDEQKLETYHRMYWDLVRDLVEAAPSMLILIDQINENILNAEYYKALKLAKKLMDYEEEAITHVSKCADNVSGC